METTKDTNPKDSIGSSKPPLSTLSAMVTHEVALALLEGACKYRRHNYRVYGVRASIYYDATQRHLNKWWEGQDIDPDSGLSHITKAIASLFVLRDAMIQDMVHDDRPPIGRPEFWGELEIMTKEILSRFPNPRSPHTQEEESKKEQDVFDGEIISIDLEPCGHCSACRNECGTDKCKYQDMKFNEKTAREKERAHSVLCNCPACQHLSEIGL